MTTLAEDHLEQVTLDWSRQLNYSTLFGPDIAPEYAHFPIDIPPPANLVNPVNSEQGRQQAKASGRLAWVRGKARENRHRCR